MPTLPKSLWDIEHIFCHNSRVHASYGILYPRDERWTWVWHHNDWGWEGLLSIIQHHTSGTKGEIGTIHIQSDTDLASLTLPSSCADCVGLLCCQVDDDHLKFICGNFFVLQKLSTTSSVALSILSLRWLSWSSLLFWFSLTKFGSGCFQNPLTMFQDSIIALSLQIQWYWFGREE